MFLIYNNIKVNDSSSCFENEKAKNYKNIKKSVKIYQITVEEHIFTILFQFKLKKSYRVDKQNMNYKNI